MERNLWPVWGNTGEFEDSSRWVVGLFPNVRSAQAASDHLNRVVADNGLRVRPNYEKREDDSLEMQALRDAGDPNAHCDYTGMEYTVGGSIRQFTDFADFKMTAARS